MAIRRFASLLVPIGPEIVLYILLSLLLLALGTKNEIIAFVFGDRQIELNTLVNNNFAQRWDLVQANTPKLATVAVMIFWSVIGTLVYTVIWTTANVSWLVKEEIEDSGSHFIHPKTWTARQYWIDILSQSLIQALNCFVLIMLVISTIRVLYPLSVDLFRPLVMTGGAVGTWVNGLLAVLLLSLIVYFGAILIRILLRRVYW